MIQKLKNQIDRQKTEIARLKRQLRQYEHAMEKNRDFLKGTAEEIELDKLIEAAKHGKALKEIREENEPIVTLACPKCLEGDYKSMKTMFGEMRSCIKCGHRETIKDE